MIKATLNVLINMLVAFCCYIGLRTAVWSNMVAAPYMAATYEQVRCNKYLAAQHDQNLAVQMGVMRKMVEKNTVPFICPIDKEGCDKAEKMWDEYEVSRKNYLSHNWTPFFKEYFHRSTK